MARSRESCKRPTSTLWSISRTPSSQNGQVCSPTRSVYCTTMQDPIQLVLSGSYWWISNGLSSITRHTHPTSPPVTTTCSRGWKRNWEAKDSQCERTLLPKLNASWRIWMEASTTKGLKSWCTDSTNVCRTGVIMLKNREFCHLSNKIFLEFFAWFFNFLQHMQQDLLISPCI